MTHSSIRHAHRAYGFTLVEILVVVVIIGLLAGIVTTQVVQALERGKRGAAVGQIASFKTALDNFYVSSGFYPSTDMGLEALTTRPSDERVQDYPEHGYLEKIPLDPWNNEYAYVSPGSHSDFDIMSYGADGLEGGDGKNADILSWDL